MDIKTKFKVNDFVQKKYDVNIDGKISAFEILEIFSQTCYAGTQVHYVCRPILCQKRLKKPYEEKGDIFWQVSHGISTREGEMGSQKYREDELVPASKEFLDALNSKSKEKA